MPDNQTVGSGQAPAPQTVNQGPAPSAPNAGAQPGGPPTPQVDANRETAIPRERFDEVNARMKAAEMQAAMLQRQLQQVQQSPTGMVHPQQAQQPAAPQAPNFDDPSVREEWKKRLVNDPIKTMNDLFALQLQTQGLPIVQQLEQRILSQVQPLHQSFVQSAKQQYEAQRAADPSFATVKPMFDAYVQTVLQQNPRTNLDYRTLHLIEQAARLDAQQQGYPVAPQAQTPAFFSERPGASYQTAPAPKPTMTDQEIRIAQQLGVSPETWMARKAQMKVGG